jgi:hypothetical protein
MGIGVKIAITNTTNQNAKAGWYFQNHFNVVFYYIGIGKFGNLFYCFALATYFQIHYLLP